jgi:hypothetical protein
MDIALINRSCSRVFFGPSSFSRYMIQDVFRRQTTSRQRQHVCVHFFRSYSYMLYSSPFGSHSDSVFRACGGHILHASSQSCAQMHRSTTVMIALQIHHKRNTVVLLPSSFSWPLCTKHSRLQQSSPVCVIYGCAASAHPCPGPVSRQQH